ncbi:hypothetical protein ACFGVR_11005 [Mucilaginibacter sp. AW1-3]
MTNSNYSIKRELLPSAFVRPALIGAGTGLVLIALFLLGAGKSNPEWNPYWRFRPLIIVPFAGAMGACAFHLARNLFTQPAWVKALATCFGTLAFLTALWLGSVIGLVGTYWH